jgi:hypothetical protein
VQYLFGAFGRKAGPDELWSYIDAWDDLDVPEVKYAVPEAIRRQDGREGSDAYVTPAGIVRGIALEWRERPLVKDPEPEPVGHPYLDASGDFWPEVKEALDGFEQLKKKLGFEKTKHEKAKLFNRPIPIGGGYDATRRALVEHYESVNLQDGVPRSKWEIQAIKASEPRAMRKRRKSRYAN